MSNTLIKYMFVPQVVRAQMVHITTEWQAMHQSHAYPPVIQKTLGDLVGAAVLLASNLKFNGALVLQIQGDGPVGLLVVECQSDLSVRATVKLRQEEPLDPNASFQQLMNAKGQGRFAVILDPYDKVPGQQPYQGVVSLQGATVAEVLEHYMQHSEQLQTRLYLATDTQKVAGLLLQKMPATGGEEIEADEDIWGRLGYLADTVKPEELLELAPDTLMHRLFHQETYQMLGQQPVAFRCKCSKERVIQVIQMLGEEEVNQILAEKGALEIACDYCLREYVFDAVDCKEVLHANYQPQDSQRPVTNTTH